MSTKTKYSWLLFDLDNTLMDFHEASHIAFHDSMRSLGLSEAQIDYNIYNLHNQHVWTEFEQGRINAVTLRSKRFQLYFDAMRHKGSDPIAANALYLDHIVKNPIMLDGAFDMIENLKQNYKLGLITNGLKEVQRPRLKAANIYNHFDAIVVSDEIGFAKPQKGYFDHVIEVAQIQNLNHAIVIGDSLHSDILGAHNYGIDSCWYNPHAKDGVSHFKATYEVQTIAEMKNLFA